MPKRELKGTVKSNKANKTIIVQVARSKKHPRYLKIMKFTKSFAAHDEQNQASEGDVVVIQESRPISKTKTWVLKEIVEKAV